MIDYLSAQRYARRKVEQIVGESYADDVLQEAALLAVASGSFRGESKFETWFYRVAVRAALYHLRTQRGAQKLGSREFVELDYSMADKRPSPEQLAIEAERAAKLYYAISKLNKRRKLAALEWLAGESLEEAARVAKLSVEAAKAARHKAKVQLREMLS